MASTSTFIKAEGDEAWTPLPATTTIRLEQQTTIPSVKQMVREWSCTGTFVSRSPYLHVFIARQRQKMRRDEFTLRRRLQQKDKRWLRRARRLVLQGKHVHINRNQLILFIRKGLSP